MTGVNGAQVGGILLAAGGSTRMGRAKQLVEFEGLTLLRRSAAVMAASVCRPSVVVLGADAKQCRNELEGLKIDVCVNETWKLGMSSSIAAGLTFLLETEPHIDAVMITLCDQLYITTKIINRFVAEYRRIRPSVVASEYNGVTGVPALFSRDMFESILNLSGDRGARGLIEEAGERVVKMNVPEAAFDIDSPDDLKSAGDPIT